MLELTPAPLPRVLPALPADRTPASVSIKFADPLHYQAVVKYAERHGIRPAFEKGIAQLVATAISYSQLHEAPLELLVFTSLWSSRAEPHFEWTLNLVGDEPRTIYAGGLICDFHEQRWTIHT